MSPTPAPPRRPRRRVAAPGAVALLAAAGMLCAATECGGAPPAPDEPHEPPRELTALPYLGAYAPASGESGVTQWDRERAWNGLNLYHSGHAPEAAVMRMDGTVVHRWARDFASIWNEPADAVQRRYWRRVHLLDDGGLLVMFSGEGLVRLDRDSNVEWARRGGFHHDMTVSPDGRIHVLTRAPATLDGGGQVLEDSITVLDGDGRPLASHSLLRALLDSEFARLMAYAPQNKADIFHTNTVQWLDGSLAGRLPAFARGNYLVSICYLSTIAVLDPRQERIVWAMRGDDTAPGFKGQHDPVALEDGNLLLFDNLGRDGFARVLELDPLTRAVAWSWGPPDFASYRLGANQRLPNGNTLITDSVNGVALEVSAAGDVVWRFVNPAQGGDSEEFLRLFLEAARAEGSVWGPEFARELERRLPPPGQALRATIPELVRIPAGAATWL